MNYPETAEQARLIAGQALERMRDLGITPHPRNFAIWYGVCSDLYPDLSRRVLALLQSGTVFSEAINEELYERFFTARAEADGMALTSQRLGNALEQIRLLFSSAHQDTEEYNGALEAFARQVIGSDPGQLQVIVTAALGETRHMLEINRHLGEELARSSKEIHDLRADLDRVRRDSLTDGLTGIANRKVFDLGVHDLTGRAAADTSRVLSLMMLDIDHFKRFNDTFGHQMGDQVLRLVAHMIRDAVDQNAIAARYGGEEFAVLLPGVALSDAVVMAERIRRHVASKHVTNRRTSQDLGCLTLSIGVTEYVVGESITQFIQRADQALYSAKGRGRNQVVSHLELEVPPQSAAS